MVLKSFSWLIAAILSIKFERKGTCKNSQPEIEKFEKMYVSSDFLLTHSHINTDTYQLNSR
jgi:hypothetical protein